MLDEEKVRLMTKLAFYEQTQGKEDLKVDEYYRKDYTGFHTICSVIWITIGYICVVGIVGLACLDWIFAHFSKNLMIMMGGSAVVAYVVLMIIYAFISRYIFDHKYKGARQRVKVFKHDLIKLLKMYEKEKK